MEEEKRLQENKKAKGLTTRQKALRKWLDDNFVSGKFFTIEEIVEGVVDNNGDPYYVINRKPQVHDKCYPLASDIKFINKYQVENFIPIIKDNKGGCKLAENKEELKEFIEGIREEAKNKAIYCNTIISKTNMEGEIPFIDINGKVLTADEMKPIEVFRG